jgi:phosphoribosylformylglycinamidine (FGAM) synthase-like enzyme
VTGRALADDAPRYVPPAAPPADLELRRAERLDDLAATTPDTAALLGLLASPNVRSRRPVWRRYDHMNGTNTLVGPGGGDAAVLRLKGTPRALALAIDGPGRLGALDPRHAGAAAALEGAMNVACSGAEPIGVTDCLNFGSPETPEGYWQLAEAVAGMADACRALDLPIVSGNVSLYNETPDGPILPTPVVGTIGLLEDRSKLVPMTWREGDEIWLLGEPATEAEALAGSELAWQHGRQGGTPHLDIDAAARVVRLLVGLTGDGTLAGAHDVSVGGLGVALARMAIASGRGATVGLPGGAAALPGAALFGERIGRVLVAVTPAHGRGVVEAAAAAGVPAELLGVALGDELAIELAGSPLRIAVEALASAWETPF